MKAAWWKEAVVYQIYPRSFMDSNGDGIGDINGITQKLDYLKDLGVDVLWLSPIFESPDDDNGYDISDYCAIMEKFGTMEDFDHLLDQAHEKGLKIILDLVVNHTSDEHRWFQSSRSDRNSPYRDFYFWREEQPSNWLSFFGGEAWEYDAETSAYYLHLFSKKQPDLNWENETVRQEVYEMMHFWLKKGVDGFRMDVIPMISKYLNFPYIDTNDFVGAIENTYTNGPRLHEFLSEMNKQVLSHYDIMSMGEGIGIKPEQGNLYTDPDRKELQMIYHFDHMSLDWGKGGKFDPQEWKLTDFKRIFREWHQELGDKGWITTFLDNHDFPRMVSRFGNDVDYRELSAKLLATLLCTLRGTPCFYQGSEIGMTNVAFESVDQYRDIESVNKIKEYEQSNGDLEMLKPILQKVSRDNARTPMQWSDEMHGGFSTAQTTWIDSNPNYLKINVEANLTTENSVLHYYKSAIQLRKNHPTLVYGDFLEYAQESESLYLYRRWDSNGDYLILLNFSDELHALPEEVKVITQTEKLLGNYLKESEKEGIIRPWEALVYRINPTD